MGYEYATKGAREYISGVFTSATAAEERVAELHAEGKDAYAKPTKNRWLAIWRARKP